MPTQKAVYGPHNTLVLRELAPSVTASDIKSLVEGMQIRKVELQPGCVLHLSNEASATAVASLLENKYGVQVLFHSSDFQHPIVFTFSIFLDHCKQHLDANYSPQEYFSPNYSFFDVVGL